MLQRGQEEEQQATTTATMKGGEATAATNNNSNEESTTSETNENTRLVSASLAQTETRWIQCLRIAVLSLLLITAILLATGVYLYTANEEQDKFTSHFEDSALQVMESFHDMVERNIGAAAALSTTLTSYAIESNQSFPFVTLPDFELHGAHARIQSGSHIIHWLPLVLDEQREKWEEYANATRGHIDVAFEKDALYRSQQDEEIATAHQRRVQANNMTVLQDGTGYHPKIYNNGALEPTRRGDEPAGMGPYLPAWQRSPVDPGKQDLLNLNFAETRVIGPGLIDTLQREKKAVLRNAAIPIPKFLEKLKGNLAISQYRQHVEDYIKGPTTFLAYPVFDSHDDESRQLVGVLATSVYWKVLFSHLLPSSTHGIIVVVSNSFNQTFSYRIDGSEATFLGMGDYHDDRYSNHIQQQSVNDYLKHQFRAENRAYPTVPLSDEVQYDIKVYPSQDTENDFVTNRPTIYTAIIICFFTFASLLFVAFSYLVEKRQQLMLQKVVENANRVNQELHELNEFLSHEVRNPLAAAISASSFITAAIHESKPMATPQQQQSVREDMEVVNSSLHFINDFLRSMLDIHKASSHQIKIEKTPTDVLQDVFEPVSAILYKRTANFEVLLECGPPGLIVLTDQIRLKQVVLNLVRNASKFVERGFIRMRALVVNNEVFLYVEDSGPGVPLEKRHDMFAKYQPSLDLLSQGTGLGLSLCKKLMTSMGGDVWLDETYDSGVSGCPGARFVVQLNTSPVDIESTLPNTDSESELQHFVVDEDSGGVAGMAADSGGTSVLPGQGSEQPQQKQHSAANAPPQAEQTKEPELPDELSVLMVDDDAVLRKLFVRALKKVRPNWTIQEASSGERALEICQSSKPHLIFLDQYMASVEKQLLGTETAQAMRSRGIKGIICGLSANDIREDFIRKGADDFVLKPMPCRPDALTKVLVQLLTLKDVSGREERDP